MSTGILSLFTISSAYASLYFSLYCCRCYKANGGANRGSEFILTFASVLYGRLQGLPSRSILCLCISPLFWKCDPLKAAQASQDPYRTHTEHRTNTSASRGLMDFQRHLPDIFAQSKSHTHWVNNSNTLSIKSRQNKTKQKNCTEESEETYKSTQRLKKANAETRRLTSREKQHGTVKGLDSTVRLAEAEIPGPSLIS